VNWATYEYAVGHGHIQNPPTLAPVEHQQPVDDTWLAAAAKQSAGNTMDIHVSAADSPEEGKIGAAIPAAKSEENGVKAPLFRAPAAAPQQLSERDRRGLVVRGNDAQVIMRKGRAISPSSGASSC